MNLLLTNDDGIYAPGLWALWEELRKEHQVTVAAPDSEQSGISHAFTLHEPLRMNSADLGNGRRGWKINGTPSDCVKLAFSKILEKKPQAVLSGINAGDNTGVSHFYSGTVAAAREAALWGVPGIAVSVARADERQFQSAARFVKEQLHRLILSQEPHRIFLNINFPPVDVDAIKGWRVTSQGCTMFNDDFEQRRDVRDRDYYWIHGEKPSDRFEAGSDDQAVQEGYIAITPLTIDSTDQNMRATLATKLQSKPGN